MRTKRVLLTLAIMGAATLMPAFDPGLAQEGGAVHFDWSAPGPEGFPAGWRPLTFRHIPRHTRYTIVTEDGAAVMKATANASASGLIHSIDADPRRTPVLRWRWKVERLISKADVARKQGDDYPARIYVAFAYDPSRASLGQRIKYEAARLIYGEYPPHSGLNYIWESKAPVGTVVPNPFTDRVRMIVVDSGPAHIGQWVGHERNIYADYKQAFGEEPPMISGIAIMTDADNTGESAIAYYGDIDLGPANTR
jgi:hypothetical protein